MTGDDFETNETGTRAALTGSALRIEALKVELRSVVSALRLMIDTGELPDDADERLRRAVDALNIKEDTATT
jgi:hypothetical protein